MTVDPLQKEPQVGRGLFGIRPLILHFKFQFSKPMKSSTVSYFPRFNLSFEKKYHFPKMPKNHPNVYTKLPNITVVNEIGRETKSCMKCDQDIGRKAVLSGVKTAFTFIPALMDVRRVQQLHDFILSNIAFICLFRHILENTVFI